MDTRFLLLGALGNIFNVFRFLLPLLLWVPVDSAIGFVVATTPLIISIALTIIGILGEGPVSADTAGIAGFLGFLVCLFWPLPLLWSISNYQGLLASCQDYVASAAIASYYCGQVPDSLFYLGFTATALSSGLMSTFAGLLILKRERQRPSGA